MEGASLSLQSASHIVIAACCLESTSRMPAICAEQEAARILDSGTPFVAAVFNKHKHSTFVDELPHVHELPTMVRTSSRAWSCIRASGSSSSSIDFRCPCDKVMLVTVGFRIGIVRMQFRQCECRDDEIEAIPARRRGWQLPQPSHVGAAHHRINAAPRTSHIHASRGLNVAIISAKCRCCRMYQTCGCIAHRRALTDCCNVDTASTAAAVFHCGIITVATEENRQRCEGADGRVLVTHLQQLPRLELWETSVELTHNSVHHSVLSRKCAGNIRVGRILITIGASRSYPPHRRRC